MSDADTKRPKWRAEAVRYVAENSINNGDLLWGKTTREGEPVPHDQAHPDGTEPILYRDFIADPPITREQFDRVQRIIAERKKNTVEARNGKPEYLLSGRLVCAHCGAPFAGFTSTKGGRRRRRYYRHGFTRGAPLTAGGSPTIDCPSDRRYVRCAPLEQQIIQRVLETICTDDLVSAIAEELAEQERLTLDPASDARITKVKQTIERTRTWLDNATEEITRSDNPDVRESSERVRVRHANTLEALRHELQQLKSARDRARVAIEQLAEMLDRAKSLVGGFHTAEPAHKKRILRAVVARIALNADSGRVELRLRLPADFRTSDRPSQNNKS